MTPGSPALISGLDKPLRLILGKAYLRNVGLHGETNEEERVY